MKITAIFAAVVTALVMAPVAAAHVTASPAELQTGYTYTEFSVPHGCDGSATMRMTIQIPAGIASVKPQEVSGWTIAIKQGALAEPVSIFGEETTEGVTEVSWTGGPLPDSHLQRFGLSFFASETLAGETVHWKVIQKCEQGVTRWIEIPVEGEEEPEEPAAEIAFLASAEEEGEASAEQTAAQEPAASDAQAASATDGDGDSDTLAIGLAIAGLVAGLVALAAVFLRRPSTARGR
jgi:periplasmic copper chaperone A